MKVLYCVRADGRDKPGGDIVQLERMVQHLRPLGVREELAFGPPEKDGDWDLVHLFNLENEKATLQNLRRFKRAGYPVAVSTIFCRTEEAQFEGSIRLDPRWRRLYSLLGWELAWRLWSWRDGRSAVTRRRFEDQRAIVDGADLLLPNSEREAKTLRDYFGRPELGAKTRVVYVGLDRESFDAAKAEPQRVRAPYELEEFVLNVGRMTPRKNQLRLIEALRDSDLPLVFIGADHSYPAYLADCKAAAAGRRGRTLFIDWVDQKELAHWYAACRVLALPTLHETANLACMEAAACGARIMSTSWAPVDEYFGDLISTCDPLDPASIRKAVLEAWDRPADGRLRERVLGFTWERFAADTFDGYRRLLAGKAKA